jgi:hypothetical protein
MRHFHFILIFVNQDKFMAKKSGKSVSFDAMIKFFMIRFEIPTRQDVQRIVHRLDQLEKIIRKNAICGKSKRSGSSKGGSGNARMSGSGQTVNASEIILKAIKGSAQGMDYARISEITHFDEKKIRNILHRLHKTGKIHRKRRGLYVVG